MFICKFVWRHATLRDCNHWCSHGDWWLLQRTEFYHGIEIVNCAIHRHLIQMSKGQPPRQVHSLTENWMSQCDYQAYSQGFNNLGPRKSPSACCWSSPSHYGVLPMDIERPEFRGTGIKILWKCCCCDSIHIVLLIVEVELRFWYVLMHWCWTANSFLEWRRTLPSTLEFLDWAIIWSIFTHMWWGWYFFCMCTKLKSHQQCF